MKTNAPVFLILNQSATTAIIEPMINFFAVPAALILSAPAPNFQPPITTSFQTQMNNIFAHMDKSRVPDGILRDYALEFVDLEYFNGTTTLSDSNYAHANSFWEVYNTLISGRISSSAKGLIAGDKLDKSWYTSLREGQVTLCGLYFNYAAFKKNAIQCITVSNNQLYDKYVRGEWQNPYEKQKAFIISPSHNEYSNTSFSILLPKDLWLTNNSGSISVNVSDGQGYRPLIPGRPLAVSYLKPGLKEWTYRLRTACGVYLYAHSLVGVGRNT